ncbi:TonB-dependent receptor (plasmid) [Lichenicola cladoniae]|uniref:TonB-dependent receptor n=1 Tax=Lichenicola cladoniae TaxID=1484109 RepID=A0A6M8HWU7_9PROT|nr:TonB-dependent receptor [Lichenicola cladoniae]NPD70139.1 TonB-dependent receptor [Acetobacteraceae bacterium]QKE93013.1 TonB-dependent receptor [Lichenicola cladoniae]
MRIRSIDVLTKRVAAGLALAAGSLVLPVAGALAQTAVTTGQIGEPSEQVTVTGSQIRQDTSSNTPITVITSKQLQDSSTVTLEQYLQRIPEFGQQGVNSNQNGGGEGVSFIELRNLGVTRTLVLIDGHRMVSSGTDTVNAVDLNNIPVSLIDHIEILRDGASAIYGSDAIAGVVNIILKKHFDGVMVNAQEGISDRHDAQSYDFSGTAGHNFQKGNILFNFEYSNRDPLPQNRRAWSQNKSLPDGSQTLGSTRTLGGLVQNPTAFDVVTGQPSINDRAFGNGVFRTFNPAQDDLLLNDYGYSSTQLDRRSFNALGHYEILPNVNLNIDALFTDHHAQQQLGPDAEGGDVVTDRYPNGFIIPASNPYNPYGVDVVDRTRRAEVGNRQYNESGSTYRLGIGLSGTILNRFDWEAGYKYGSSNDKFTFTNQYNQTYILQVSVYLPCSAADAAQGCSVGNFFGPNTLTPAQARYIGFTQTNKVDVGQHYWFGKVTGPILQLPAGPFSFALGGELRHESGKYAPDSVITSGNGDFDQASTAGSFNVKEGYLEFKVPVLKDMFMAKELSVDGAARYSDYSNFGNATTWNVSVAYAPTRDIRFRFNTGTGFRSPSITDLYSGQYEAANTVNDPCDVNVGLRRSNANAAANCNRVLSSAGLSPASFMQQQTQLYTYIGGNSRLQPETSRQLDLGTVITPRWIPDLSMTVDYYRIKIANHITAPDAQTILDSCYASTGLSSPQCLLVGNRGGGQLTTVSAINTNSGFVNTDGLDFGLNYNLKLSRLGLPSWAGRLEFSNLDTLLLNYTEQLPNGDVRQDAGAIISTTTPQAFTRFKSTNSIAYVQPKWSFQWTIRYIGGSSNYVSPGEPADTSYGGSVGPIVYHDIVGSYALKVAGKHTVTLIAGIDNMFDRDPPFYYDGSTNSLTNSYDYLGRYYYFKAGVRF